MSFCDAPALPLPAVGDRASSSDAATFVSTSSICTYSRSFSTWLADGYGRSLLEDLLRSGIDPQARLSTLTLGGWKVRVEVSSAPPDQLVPGLNACGRAVLTLLWDADEPLSAERVRDALEDRRLGIFRNRIEDVLAQLFGHSSYHRGQIATLVKAAGGEPAITDLIYWCRESVPG